MAGTHTLAETERQVSQKLAGMSIDFERTVLAPAELSWTAFVVLWVVWIWEPIETRSIAEEGGFSKATLTGVLNTLEGKGLLVRSRSESDGRIVDVRLTKSGKALMKKLFPKFNLHEQNATSPLSSRQKTELANSLRLITGLAESQR
jgi:DNA-binding MarR family transcriptional regulator